MTSVDLTLIALLFLLTNSGTLTITQTLLLLALLSTANCAISRGSAAGTTTTAI